MVAQSCLHSAEAGVAVDDPSACMGGIVNGNFVFRQVSSILHSSCKRKKDFGRGLQTMFPAGPGWVLSFWFVSETGYVSDVQGRERYLCLRRSASPRNGETFVSHRAEDDRVDISGQKRLVVLLVLF